MCANVREGGVKVTLINDSTVLHTPHCYNMHLGIEVVAERYAQN